MSMCGNARAGSPKIAGVAHGCQVQRPFIYTGAYITPPLSPLMAHSVVVARRPPRRALRPEVPLPVVCTPCTCGVGGRARISLTLRTPCTCCVGGRARTSWARTRTPCTCSVGGRVRIATPLCTPCTLPSVSHARSGTTNASPRLAALERHLLVLAALFHRALLESAALRFSEGMLHASVASGGTRVASASQPRAAGELMLVYASPPLSTWCSGVAESS